MKLIKILVILPSFFLCTGCCLKPGFPSQTGPTPLDCGSSGKKTMLVLQGPDKIGGYVNVWNLDIGQKPYVRPYTSVALKPYEEKFAVAIKVAQACGLAAGKCQAQGDFVTQCGKPTLTMNGEWAACDTTASWCHE